MRVEELGRVGGDGGFLLRLLERRRAGQVLVHRVLRVDDRRQRESGADAAEECLQRLAPRDAGGLVDWCDGDGLRLVGSLSHERSLAPEPRSEPARRTG